MSKQFVDDDRTAHMPRCGDDLLKLLQTGAKNDVAEIATSF